MTVCLRRLLLGLAVAASLSVHATCHAQAAAQDQEPLGIGLESSG
jgi:hypothetical protein